MPNKNATILHLGCGNSPLGEDLYHAGYKQITNIDYSTKVIEFMRNRTMDLSEMKWVVGDIFYLDQCFTPESFDIALDKGTLGTILVI
jgi:ubiquinone/menaquinone biosynthesis C-methylase UbiE